MTTEPDTASPDGKKKKILDRVSFEALGESLIGTVTAIKGEALTVVDENGREWTLGIDDLTPYSDE